MTLANPQVATNEWARAAISAAVGAASALISLPISNALGRWLKRHEIRRALYSELQGVYSILRNRKERGYSGMALWKELFETPAYDYYFEHNRDIFVSLKDEYQFRDTFNQMALIRGRIEKGEEIYFEDQSVTYLWDTFEYGLDESLLSRRYRAVKRMKEKSGVAKKGLFHRLFHRGSK